MKFFKKRHLPDSANKGEEVRKVRKTEIDDFISYARKNWYMVKDKTISITTEVRNFLEFSGCGVLVMLEFWELFPDNFFILDGG